MWRLFFLIATASAQIPSLGFCPEYQPMANFNMNRYLGTWYEAERYFTISELGSRCVTTRYESTPEGRILVTNEITNAMTGMKRVLDGHLQLIGREGEGRMIVKYATLPVPYDTEFNVLDTDYESYAVMWSCSGIGPVHIQNAWVLTRDRLAPPLVLQKAYSALERFRVSRTFFIKTNQEDCYILPDPAAFVEYKDAGNEEISGKHASMVPVAAASEPVQVAEKNNEPVVQPEIPKIKSAIPEIIDEPKSEVMMASESMKKEEKMEMPEKPAEEMKEKPEMKKSEVLMEMEKPVKYVE